VSIPRETPTFKGSFENVYGYDAWNVQYENTGMSAFDYWDTNRFLRANPAQLVPYLSFANGKNDGAIGWTQAWKTVNALIDTRQPFKFSWGQNGHGERSTFPGGSQTTSTISIRKNKTLPALTHCTLDNVMGGGTNNTGDGDLSGQINGYSMWNPATSADTSTSWVMDVYLLSSAPQSSSRVDVTPRRCQQFKPTPGTFINRSNKDLVTNNVLESGTVMVDQYGLVTIPQTVMSKNRNRITLTISSTRIPGDANIDGTVDVVDLGTLAMNYDLQSGATYAMGDFNGDGKVDVVDLGILASHYDMFIAGGASMAESSQRSKPLAMSVGLTPAEATATSRPPRPSRA
jgi:hypothetical protein